MVDLNRRSVAVAFTVLVVIVIVWPRQPASPSAPASFPSTTAATAHQDIHRAISEAVLAVSQGGASSGADSAMDEAVRLLSALRTRILASSMETVQGESPRAGHDEHLLWPPAPPPAGRHLISSRSDLISEPPIAQSLGAPVPLSTPSPYPPPPPVARSSSAAMPKASVAPASPQSAVSRFLRHSPALLRLHAHATQLRLYVYEPPLSAGWSARNLTRSFPRCATFQWSGDAELTERIRTHPTLATTDPSRADYFVVPFLSKCYFNYVAKYRLAPMDSTLHAVLSYLKWSGPWWSRHPERHLFFFMSGART